MYTASRSRSSFSSKKFKAEDFKDVETRVMRAAYEIINRKRATYYAIGISLFTIVQGNSP